MWKSRWSRSNNLQSRRKRPPCRPLLEQLEVPSPARDEYHAIPRGLPVDRGQPDRDAIDVVERQRGRFRPTLQHAVGRPGLCRAAGRDQRHHCRRPEHGRHARHLQFGRFCRHADTTPCTPSTPPTAPSSGTARSWIPPTPMTTSPAPLPSPPIPSGRHGFGRHQPGDRHHRHPGHRPVHEHPLRRSQYQGNRRRHGLLRPAAPRHQPRRWHRRRPCFRHRRPPPTATPITHRSTSPARATATSTEWSSSTPCARTTAPR